jgi:HEAT repeat protein
MFPAVLSRLVFVGLLAVALCARADQEQDLLTLLKSTADAPQKCDACLKLRQVGTVKSVPALAALLSEERTGQAARYALEGMPFPEATKALREALGKTSGPVQFGLIDSAGWRRDAKAVSLLQKALLGTDPTNATAAACALGRIGDKKAIAALTEAQAKVQPALQPAVQDGLLRCAEQLLAGGDAKGAATLYRNLSTPNVAERIRVAAWRGLALADASGRTALVSAALTGQDRPLHLAALQVLRQAKDAALVDACLRQWSTLPADAQLAVLDARLKLGGAVAPVVRTASQSPNVAVRLVAWQALGTLGDATAIPALTKATLQGEPAEREAARESLATLRGANVDSTFYAQLAKASTDEKVVLLRALGERSDAKAANVLLENAAATQPEAVRLAALEALRRIAEPSTTAPLLTLAAKAKSDADSEPVLSALYAVCQASPDKNQAARTVLNALKPLPNDEARRVLPVLAELATPEALAAAQSAAQAKQDPETAKAAVRVLAQWPNAAPASSLLALAGTSTDSTLQVLALRGAISVAGQEPDNAKRLALLQQAMTAAKRPEEKKQALGQLGQVATPEALQAAMGYLADADLANEAGLAAVTIAEKLAPTQPDLARETATKVLAQCNTPDIVKRAWAIRGKPLNEGPFIMNWLVAGPYSKPGITGATALFDLVFAPEQPGATVAWKPLPRGKTADLATFFPEQANCVAYLKSQIVALQDCDAALLLGSDDGVKAWLNGTVVHSNNVDRGMVADQDIAPLKLKKGTNELLLKVTQGGGGWGACARVVGTNGQPIKGLKYQVEQ